MRKTLRNHEKGGRTAGQILAATTLAVSLATFGCSTTDSGSTVSGQPRRSAPAAGNMSTSPTSMPGSSSGTIGIPPQGMVSAAPSSVDAIAVLRADQAFRGVALGPAADGVNTQPSVSMQQVTGQAGWPSLIANPQITVNSSISSPGTVGIPSDAGGGVAIVAVPSAGFTAGAVSGAIVGGTVGVANTGVTGVSNATATPLTNQAAGATVAGTQGNGLVRAINPAAGSTVATPTFGTSPRLNVENGIAVRGGAGDINVVPGTNGGNATANGIVLNGRTSGLTAGATTGNMTTVTAGVTAGTATSGVARGNVTLGGASMTNGSPATATNSVATGNVVIQPTAGRRRAVSTSTGTGNIQIVTNASGSVTVTNMQPESRLRRAARVK